MRLLCFARLYGVHHHSGQNADDHAGARPHPAGKPEEAITDDSAEEGQNADPISRVSFLLLLLQNRGLSAVGKQQPADDCSHPAVIRSIRKSTLAAASRQQQDATRPRDRERVGNFREAPERGGEGGT